MDILPFNEAITRDGLELEEGRILNMAGFSYVVPNAVAVPIEGGPTLPLAPLPLYVLLKLVAFSDREESKDLASVLHCLKHYLEDDDRRYRVDHDGEGVPYEYTAAYVVGDEAKPFLDASVSVSVNAVLNRFDSPEATVIGVVAREMGKFIVEDEHRLEIFELFRWCRFGTGL